MIKVHCNICDKVIERSNSQGDMVVVFSLNKDIIFLHIRPMFKKRIDKKQLELTILQQVKGVEDSLEDGHICSGCLLNILSDPNNRVLDK